MEEVRKKGEDVLEVSVGLDGDWFLRTDARHGTPDPTFPSIPLPWTKTSTVMMLQHAKQYTTIRT